MDTKDTVIKGLAEKLGASVEGGELVIRTGAALPLHEPVTVAVSGNIDSVYRWLQHRETTIDQLSSFISVNREAMSISLRLNEKEWDGTVVGGKLQLSPEFLRLNINDTERRMSTFEMADLIKMNRTFFSVRNDAMVLVSELRNFKARVEKVMEQSDDRRGNTTMIRNQAVDSNIPSDFRLNIPIFRGMPRTEFTVEVDIDPSDLSCALISPEAADYIEDMRNNIIDSELSKIYGICPNIVIIEV